MEGCGFESNTTSSSSSGEEPNTSCPSPVLDLKSNLSAVNNSSIKKSGGRRSVQKRVVSVPIAEVDGSRPRGSGEGAPPSDSWTWRKYGQKPIKGSPYPRGYYRCSSSKGCPARKQVERSRLDPTMLLITYASDHNHPWPLPKSKHHHTKPQQTTTTTTTTTTTPPTTLPTTSPEDPFSSDLPHDSPLMLSDHFWNPYVPDTSLTMMPPVTFEDVGKDLSGAGGEEDALFEGLGELPECSVVFRRAEESRRWSLMASSWCGSSG